MTNSLALGRHNDFSELYISLRSKEGRIYSDEELLLLPEVRKDHPLKKEWEVRSRSSAKLVKYLIGKQSPLHVLEIGCGNGWLSNKIASIGQAQVTGIDINGVELEQARRVFTHPALEFIQGGLTDLPFKNRKFDIILFASSIQYFHSLAGAVRMGMQLLAKKGEIHILDSKFYPADEIANARLRSREYFSAQGSPLMESYYFHHSLDDLTYFQYRVINKFQLRLERFTGNNSSFPWIRIKKQLC